MEKKTIGILALVLVGMFALSFAVALPFGSDEDKVAAKTAIEEGDFESWKSLIVSQLTEENFEEMQERHESRDGLGCARHAESEGAVGGCGMNKGQGPKDGTGPRHADCPFAN